MAITQAYKDIFMEMIERYVKSRLNRGDYEPKPATQGLIIGGADVAASVMAAGKTPEKYSLPRESMPNLAENRREITGDNLIKTDNPIAEKNTNKRSYGSYGRFYDRYKEKLYGVKSKLWQIYKNPFEKLANAVRSFYDGRIRTGISRNSYNPFRKSRLEAVAQEIQSLPSYQTMPPSYPIRGNSNSKRNVLPYTARKRIGDLEERVEAA